MGNALKGYWESTVCLGWAKVDRFGLDQELMKFKNIFWSFSLKFYPRQWCFWLFSTSLDANKEILAKKSWKSPHLPTLIYRESQICELHVKMHLIEALPIFQLWWSKTLCTSSNISILKYFWLFKTTKRDKVHFEWISEVFILFPEMQL